jgi:hypothetical protein
LKAEVRAGIYRRPSDGRYQLLGGIYNSIEEAEAAALQRCTTESKPPLSMFTDFERAQEREQRHERQESAYLDRFRIPVKRIPKKDETTERVKDMARKLTWKDDQ